ncbi:glycosyltransferase [Pelagibius litoralis]|uniref:Glycosyltransferase n=1 Tax=Pelagibius litoralis TaxID=374515 RepID=A0A967EWP8_9PROT|nr:glycosyltransferase [Pelagibius litoralis]NIA67728.1 glycosyltransferase [Pelagibius litoralis]
MARFSGDLSTTAVVPTFNRAVFLTECLNAILAQSLQPAQIIVVDDGSNDGTEETLRRFGNAVEVVRMPNRGKSAGLNVALARARHPLIWIVDDDDLVLPDALAVLTDLIKTDGKAGFAYGRYNRFSVDPETGCRHIFDTGYWRQSAPDDFLTATLEDFFVHQPGMLVRRSLYDRVGPFNEGLPRSQDYDMLIRLARVARSVATETIVFLQRQHDGYRGTASGRFSSDQRVARWIKADKEILQRCYAELDLSEFLPSRRIDGPEATRRATLQRAAIMARKKLWEPALNDFEAAASIGGAKLSNTEKNLLKRAMLSKYGCDEILQDKSISHRIRALSRQSETGRQIARGLARGLVWRIREQLRDKSPLRAAHYARLGLAWTLPTSSPPNPTARLHRRPDD